MKKILAAILAGTLLYACSLKEDQDSYESPQTFYKTPVQCQSAVNGCYPPLHAIFVPIGFFFSVEGVTDLFYTDYAQTDAQLDISPSYSGCAATVWNNAYVGVARCNEVIYGIENICPLDMEDKMPYAAEARVMRALYYYLLTNVFGDVPYYTFRVMTKEDIAAVRDIPRIPANEIRAALYTDLKEKALPWFTAGNGLKVRTSDAPSNRSGYALCLMLMAKFAMWYEDWDGALEPLKELEALYGELNEENYPLEQIMWRFKNVPESIFEVQSEYQASGIKYACKVAYVAQPTSNGNGRYDGVSMPELGTTVIHGEGIQCNSYYGAFRPAQGNEQKENTADAQWSRGLFNPLPLTYNTYSSSLGRYSTKVDSVTVAKLLKGESASLRGKKVDRRTVYKLGMAKLDGDYTGGGNTFTFVKNYGRPWAGPEFWRYNQTSNNDGNNYHILRYADAVLMMAECYARKNEVDLAQKYVNLVRARALVDPLPYSSQEDMLSNILDERARELGGEFHRKWDLVRWGETEGSDLWYDRVNSFNFRIGNAASGKSMTTLRRYHKYYPIPDTECALTGYKLNNEAYAKNE